MKFKDNSSITDAQLRAHAFFSNISIINGYICIFYIIELKTVIVDLIF